MKWSVETTRRERKKKSWNWWEANFIHNIKWELILHCTRAATFVKNDDLNIHSLCIVLPEWGACVLRAHGALCICMCVCNCMRVSFFHYKMACAWMNKEYTYTLPVMTIVLTHNCCTNVYMFYCELSRSYVVPTVINQTTTATQKVWSEKAKWNGEKGRWSKEETETYSDKDKEETR